MSLRLKLLLLGLATLVLPWGGCNYAREMESALREGERTSLIAVAQTIAASLEGRTDLLYREAPPAVESEAASRPELQLSADAAAERALLTPARFDVRPLALSAAPLLDGYAADWPRETGAWNYYSKDAHHHFGMLTGVYERMLYVLLEVHDEHPVFDAAGTNALDPATFGDRLWIGFQDPDGEEQQLFLAVTAPGAVTARRIESGDYGERSASLEPRVRGAWQPSADGYRIEVRIPLSMLGPRFGVLLDDRDRRGAVPVSYGSLSSDDLHTLGRLLVASPDLGVYLAQFLQPGMKLAALTPDGRVLAHADALSKSSALGREPPLLARVYRRFVDRPGERQLIEAGADIYDRDHVGVVGRVEVTQTADRWISLRDHALTRMLNFTVITSVVAVIAMFAFAAWLALRLARLRRASESALTHEGLATDFPETTAPDELGDVARSFSTLLARLGEHTSYLRTLAGKLAHEIRTPLTIVRSSLDNLEAGAVGAEERTYLARAREGSERLGAILVAMGAASRVEEAIGSAERTDFDLHALIASAVAAYRVAFPHRIFVTQLPPEPVQLSGAPDLIVQMLDKLIDNAVDFSVQGSTITVRLQHEEASVLVEVDNSGPALPAGGKPFESLWQSRPDDLDSRPHFGLGLYIVRLIAEFHGGEPFAANLADGSGVRVGARLARHAGRSPEP